MIKLERVTAYTIPEAAEIMHVSGQTIRNLIHEGRLRAQKIGNRWYVTDKTLEEFVSAADNAFPVVSSDESGEEV